MSKMACQSIDRVVRKKRLVCWTTAFSVVVLGASPALAVSDTTGTIVELGIYANSHTVNIKLSVPPAGTPASCATTTTYAGVIDISTSGGQAQYSALMRAQESGVNVRIIGNGTCNLTSGLEDVSAVRFPE